MLLHGQQVGQQLGRMKLGGQAVPHRHTGMFRQRFHQFLTVTAILNAIVHPAQHPRGVAHRLFMADLAATRAKIGDVCTLIVSGNFERASGTGRVFFEDERDVFTFQILHFAGAFFRLF